MINNTKEKTAKKLRKKYSDLLTSSSALKKSHLTLQTERNKLAAKSRKQIAGISKEKKLQKKRTDILEKETRSAAVDNIALKKANVILVKSKKKVNIKRKKEKAIFTIKIESGDEVNKELKLTVEKGNKAAKMAKAIIKKKEHEIDLLNQELTNFTYVASHDLQEPLRKIQMIAALILEKEEKNLSKEGKSYFVRMLSSAKRIRNLIQDLINYSNTSSTFFKIEDTDLNAILKQVKKELEKTIAKSGASITSSKLNTLTLAPFQIRKIFRELIINSIKFSRPNVTPIIRITSRLIKGRDLKESSLSARKTYCHISFADNGIGFDQKYSARIFKIFQKLDSGKAAGSGIGLATCKKIIENYGGIIKATGELGKGATFDIYLPLKPIKKIKN